jgi:putative hydrolase of HD superfamily
MDPAPGAPSDLQRILDFVIEMDRLKGVLRRARPVGLDRYENTAEHSWHVCVLVLLLVRYFSKPVDVQRVLEILLVHDIPEIDCGDQFVFTRDPVATAIAERAAAERIFGLLPSIEGDWLLSRWREYEDRATPEALLAYVADRLMPILHNVRGGARSWRENGVARERVLAISVEIAECCPEVWAAIEPLIDDVYAEIGATPQKGA